ncbi:beta-xylosidase [Streptomyces sp. NPDC050085]|uniref:beta-xylosidase n=1 Tax=Streptomyces sp. NPDC050085 TaxID=3365600 RepID=UPI0037A909D5
MASSSRRRRWAATFGVAALAATAGGSLVLPGSALAAPAGASASAAVDFATHCVPPPIAGIPDIDGTTTAQISVDNATPKVGDTVTVTYKVVKPAAGNPVDLALPADIMTPTGKVQLGGAQSGSVTVAGPKKNDPVPGKAPFPSFSMTGTFKVTEAGAITLSPGDYNIHTSYIMELDTPCTVTNPPAPVSETVTATGAPTTNERSLQLSSASGKVGDSVTATGTKFTAGASVTVAGFANGAVTGDKATATADAQGAFSVALPVNDKATTGVVAYEGASWNADKGAGPAAYAVTDGGGPHPPGSLDQKLNTQVNAGELTMAQAGDAVAMDAVGFGKGGRSRGSLNTVTVQDFRGGAAGWSLTGKVTNFTGPGGASIDAGKLSWTPVCVDGADSPSHCAAGSPGAVGKDGATLASAPNQAFTGGQFTVDARLSLNVPAYTKPGAYSAVLTLTLT